MVFTPFVNTLLVPPLVSLTLPVFRQMYSLGNLNKLISWYTHAGEPRPSDIQSSQMHEPEIFSRIYLNDTTDKGGSEDVLESKYYRAEQLASKFTVARQVQAKKYTYYKYYVFDNPEHFFDYLEEQPEDDRSFHEVIFGWMLQKIKLDIDACDEDITSNILEAIDEAIYTTFYMQYDIVLSAEQIITTESNGFDLGSTHPKKSYHKIVNGFAVENNIEAQEFTRKLMCILPSEYHKFIDIGVNKNVQNFRLIGCKKLDSKRTKILTKESIHVSPIDTIIQNVTDCAVLPKRAEQDTKQTPLDGKDLLTDDIETAINLAESENLLDGFVSTHVKGRLICFKRIKSSFCKMCDRTHQSENSLMITVDISPDGVARAFAKCRRNKDKESTIFLGEWYSLEVAVGENVADVNKRIDKRKQRISNIIERTIEKKPGFSDRNVMSGLDDAQTNIYDEPYMLPYEHTDTLCVIGGMKMGKTKQLVNYINANFKDTDIYKHSIKFVSFRQTFSANIKDKFSDFTLYSDVKTHEIKHLRAIIQVESLHRLHIDVHTPHPDLVVLDETELILEQFNSGLLKQFNKAWATFQWLLANAKHVVCLDATMSDRTLNTMMKMRVNKPNGGQPRQLFLHHNKHRNASDDNYYFTGDQTQFYASLYDDLKQNLKIAIPTNSLTFAEVVRANIAKKYPDKAIGFYSSRTSMATKKDHFENVDTAWSSYDVLIYTPTVSAGVSFEVKHFDKVYAWFTDLSCTVEVCLQMLGRIRDVSKKEYVIGLDLNGGYYPTTTKQIRDELYKSRENLFKMTDDTLLNFEYTNAGKIKFYESDYFNLWLENKKVTNISKNAFVKRLSAYLDMYGAQLHMLVSEHTDEALNEISNENKDTKTKIKTESREEIANADDLNDREIVEIQDKFMRQDELTPRERFSYEKYKLRRDYNFGNEMTVEFVTRYDNRKLRRIYKNLVSIHSASQLEFSLDNIKENELENYRYIMEQTEGAYQYNDINRRYVYDSHRIAVGIILMCEWVSLFDKKYKSEATLAEAFRANENTLYTNLVEHHNLFNIRAPKIKIFKWDSSMTDKTYVDNIVKYINRVLDIMYGVRILKKRGDTVYHLSEIKHFSFDKTEMDSVDRPNIYSKWQPRIVENSGSGEVPDVPPRRNWDTEDDLNEEVNDNNR